MTEQAYNILSLIYPNGKHEVQYLASRCSSTFNMSVQEFKIALTYLYELENDFVIHDMKDIITLEITDNGKPLIAWTDRGRKLLELKNWYAFLAWDESDKLTPYREIIDVNKMLDYQKESAKILSDFNDSMKHDKIIGNRPTTEIHQHFHGDVKNSQFSQGNNADTAQNYNSTSDKSKWDKILTLANLIKLIISAILAILFFFGVKNWNDIKKLMPERQEYKQGDTTKSHI